MSIRPGSYAVMDYCNSCIILKVDIYSNNVKPVCFSSRLDGLQLLDLCK